MEIRDYGFREIVIDILKVRGLYEDKERVCMVIGAGER